MSIGRRMGWVIAILIGLIPFNWMRLWIARDVPESTTIFQLAIGTLICWGIAGALGYFLIISAKGLRIQAARQHAEFQQLLASPLTEVAPHSARLKAGEKAYSTVAASLQEMKTVGYSAGTKGVSVRVAKGLTLRSSGTRGHAVKGMVAVAQGELVITDRRVIFAGDRKSFAIQLDDLLNCTNYTDGFGFNDAKTSYTLVTNNNQGRILFQVALGKVLSLRQGNAA